jgi:hypothetical protein
VEKDTPNIWDSIASFKKVPKVNNRPIGAKFAQSGHPGSYSERRHAQETKITRHEDLAVITG